MKKNIHAFNVALCEASRATFQKHCSSTPNPGTSIWKIVLTFMAAVSFADVSLVGSKY